MCLVVNSWVSIHHGEKRIAKQSSWQKGDKLGKSRARQGKSFTHAQGDPLTLTSPLPPST